MITWIRDEMEMETSQMDDQPMRHEMEDVG
jgi:hypothetical protein